MKALGNVIRLATCPGAKDTLDVVGVDEKTDDLLIVDLVCGYVTSERCHRGTGHRHLHLAWKVRSDAYAGNHHWRSRIIPLHAQ